MKVKKIPQRTCIGCRNVFPKKDLIRIVRTPDGEVVVDQTGKKSGRGAYNCPNPDCLEAAFKGPQLEKALEVKLDEAIKTRLREEIVKLIK
ncbi:MAG TPA: YlxR family protein [Bacillota bacterium]|jgi:predicted RNA-binding protein YlxR (DUF448 family)|nr:YlxR family protein [Bacillota bacterium]HOL09370.1 YlxR family protein [Bacillota bacterium]HPO97081.1 YlxR family protein [Bacillota bacterium]